MTKLNLGYCRVSFRTQSLERQLATMRKLGIEERFIFRDTASEKNFEREGYISMKKVIREGDCLYIDSLDRLGRDYEAIISEWKHITRELKCDIVALDNSGLFDSKKFREMGDIGRLLEDQMLALLAYVADVERKKTLERQKQGIATAKKAGVRFGRPSSVSDWELFDRTAKRWERGEITAAEACRITGCKKTSWYKYTKERGYLKEDTKTQQKSHRA